jgi:ATP-dependent protease ClpP protease subunit
LFFRNTDSDTQKRLTSLIPENPRKGIHVVAARPISTLSVGECYDMLPDGEWGRGQITLKGLAVPDCSSSEQESGTGDFAHKSKHQLNEEITEQSMLKLCEEIDFAVNYYQSRHITIEICSPGGITSALQHFISRMAAWRERGVIIETVAMISVASAAAMILSLGDLGHRYAYSGARLLYHNASFSPETNLTKEAHAHLAERLQRTDDEMMVGLTKHVFSSNNSDDGKASVLIDLHALGEYEMNGRKMSRYLHTLSDLSLDDEESVTREQYEAVLKELFYENMFIDPDAAKMLGLIDRVIG